MQFLITTVTLNPAIDREYFVEENKATLYEDILHQGDINVTPGGKGLIASINLKNLGHEDVQNMGFLGGGQGLFFEKLLQDYSLTTNYVYTRNEMRNNVKIIGKNPMSYSHYNDYTYEIANNCEADFLKRFQRSIVDSDLVLIAGSIPQGISEDIYAKMIRICHTQKKSVFLHATGTPLQLAIEEKPLIVFPYFKGINKILGRDVETLKDCTALAAKLLSQGLKYVVLPFGCNKLIFSRDEAHMLYADELCLRSYLGSGDAFSAGFLDYTIHQDFDFLKACMYGAAASMHILQTKSVFIEQRSDIENMLPKIRSRKIGGI